MIDMKGIFSAQCISNDIEILGYHCHWFVVVVVEVVQGGGSDGGEACC